MVKNSKQISPARAWAFTLNNWTESERSSLVQQLLENSEEYYFCIGKEVGESDTPHLQGFIQAKDPKFKWRPLPSWSVMRNGVNVCHYTKMRKNRDANYNYCKKDGDFETNCPPPRNSRGNVPQVVAKSVPKGLPEEAIYKMYLEKKLLQKYKWADYFKRVAAQEMGMGEVSRHLPDIHCWYKW